MHYPPGELWGGRNSRRVAGLRERGEEMRHGRISECLGAHVSVKGGVHRAPVRGRAIGATAIQVFTKTPGQWREPEISSDSFQAFRSERERLELSSIVAHDSYLI